LDRATEVDSFRSLHGFSDYNPQAWRSVAISKRLLLESEVNLASAQPWLPLAACAN